MDGIFAGGDCVTGPASAIKAIAAGKVAAANIDEYLGFRHEITVDVTIPDPDLRDRTPHGRVNKMCIRDSGIWAQRPSSRRAVHQSSLSPRCGTLPRRQHRQRSHTGGTPPVSYTHLFRLSVTINGCRSDCRPRATPYGKEAPLPAAGETAASIYSD